MTRFSHFLAPVLLALGACDADARPSRTETPPPAEVRPASVITALAPVDARTLRFRVTAPDHPLYLENCNGAFSWGLQHEVAGAWEPAWTVATNGCHSAPIEIAAGTSRELTEVVWLGSGERLPAGRYRIALYGLYRTHDDGDHAASIEVPQELRLSEPLELGPLSGPRHPPDP